MITYCLGCGRFFQAQQKNLLICPACLNNLPIFPPGVCVFSGGKRDTGYIEKTMGFDHMDALYYYNGVIKHLIRGYKYGRNFHALRTLRTLLTQSRQKFDTVLSEYDFLVTVPSHWFSLFRRGINPAGMLCSRALPITHQHGYVKKIKYLPPMAFMSGRERKESLRKQIFYIDRRHQIFFKGKSILIFDDVMTTGTTIRALAKSIRKSGAAKIGCLIFARNMQRGL